YVYWTDTAKRSVWWIKKDGTGGPVSASVPISENSQETMPLDVAADADRVYFSAGDVHSVGKDGKGLVTAESLDGYASRIAVDDSTVFFLTESAWVLSRFAKGSTKVERVMTRLNGAKLESLSLSGDYAYLSDTHSRTIVKAVKSANPDGA